MASDEQREWVDFGQRSGLRCHRVSIGAMRLPQDDDAAVALMRQAIDAGMIYIDTCRCYGDSELKVGKSLKNGYREKVILSTKWSPWIKRIEESDDTSAECTYRRIVESIERLQVDYLDFYQVWSINSGENFRHATEKGGMLDGIRRAVDEGLVRHIGFTTHAAPDDVSRFIEEADWCEAILFTYNILNQRYKEMVAKAHEHGIATIVMNPVAGGILAEDSPVIKEATGLDDLVEYAHRYLAADTNVDTILCGISKPSDITSTLMNYTKSPLTPAECDRMEQVARKLSKEGMGFCTTCGYCKPCPQSLNIPGIMHVAYLDRLLRCPEAARNHYSWVRGEDGMSDAGRCKECGDCEPRCPQHLPIIDEMRYVAKKFK